MDLKSFARWDDYTRARRYVHGNGYRVGALVCRRSDDKRRARLNIIEHLARQHSLRGRAAREGQASQAPYKGGRSSIPTAVEDHRRGALKRGAPARPSRPARPVGMRSCGLTRREERKGGGGVAAGRGPASTAMAGMANRKGLGRSFGTLTPSILSPGRSFWRAASEPGRTEAMVGVSPRRKDDAGCRQPRSRIALARRASGGWSSRHRRRSCPAVATRSAQRAGPLGLLDRRA